VETGLLVMSDEIS